MNQLNPSKENHSAASARFVVGIDLGTTNSAVCYVDMRQSPWQIRTFRIPQLVGPGQVESREILPSFHYQPAPGEFPAGAIRLPWQGEEPGYVVGFFARDHGALSPGRLVSSAKSWLCHSGVDRTAPLLPWQGAADCPKISPIEASTRYLRHIREAWDDHFPEHPLAEQDIVLTLPASFDEVARQLTIRAAAAAGLPRVVLLEEPQAAFYAWIYAHQDDWHTQVQAGQKILVCDIGGGTTDFTLIRVRLTEDGRLQFHRVAVGNHLILGGDNLDLALAHHVEQRLRREMSHLPGQTHPSSPSGEGTPLSPPVAQSTSSPSGAISPSSPSGGIVSGEPNTGTPMAKPTTGPLGLFSRNAPPVSQTTPPSDLQATNPPDENMSRSSLEGENGRSSRPSDSVLTPRQWSVLVGLCRQAKEILLAQDAPERYTLTIPGTGSRLIGGAISVELTRQEVEEVLLEGFFPRVPLDARPAARRSGFQEFGLPYAPDSAVTRYLASFLTAHRHVAEEELLQDADHDPARPDIVLFNGGLFYAPTIRKRIVEVLQDWFGPPKGGMKENSQDSKNKKYTQNTQEIFAKKPPSPSRSTSSPAPNLEHPWSPLVLENQRLDLAVAQGAAYYGMVRRGQGVRIAAGLARSYYVGVAQAEDSPTGLISAICLLPAGIEPGQEIALTAHRFRLRVGEPVEFPLYFSSTRLTDRPGQFVPIDLEQLTPLPPIRTVLRTRKKQASGCLEVVLHAQLTEIGTLELWCTEPEGRHRWRLEFDVRSATQTDMSAHQSAAEAEGFLDESVWQGCREALEKVFGPQAEAKPAGLMKQLAQAIGAGREQWPASLLRRIWETLMELESGRRRSEAHEARWLNLLGYALRPGYGLAVDDWRVAETWRRLQGKLYHPTPGCRTEWWILWRRIGGGLSAGQQQAIADPLLAPLRAVYRQLTTSKQPGKGMDLPFGSHELGEIFRLLGSLERLPLPIKMELGTILLELLGRKKWASCQGAILWAIGRLGARQLVYGPLNAVLPTETACQWIDRLLQLKLADPMLPLALMQLTRLCHDRYRDLPDKVRHMVLQWLTDHQAPEHFLVLVREGGTLDAEEEGLIFGESLPVGLEWVGVVSSPGNHIE